jgi:biopolymer transport protein ExbB
VAALLGALLLMFVSAPAHTQQPAASGASSASQGTSGDGKGALASSSVATSASAAAPSAVASAAAAAPAVSAVPAALLPRDLSPWQMFLSADPVVKAVIVLLAFASVLTWTVCLSKSIELARARRRVRFVSGALETASSLDAAAEKSPKEGPAADLIAAAVDEIKASAHLSAEGIKERIAIRLGRIEVAARQTIARGTGLLATIGSVAPFVGLFGTVWGIMHSFIGISRAHTTNLAIVAPGIAEALLATALGLVAAIPAVIIYNAFARSITGYRTLLEDVSAQIVRLVSLALDQPCEEAPSRAKAAR